MCICIICVCACRYFPLRLHVNFVIGYICVFIDMSVKYVYGRLERIVYVKGFFGCVCVVVCF